jgi:hypothetical protein
MGIKNKTTSSPAAMAELQLEPGAAWREPTAAARRLRKDPDDDGEAGTGSSEERCGGAPAARGE